MLKPMVIVVIVLAMMGAAIGLYTAATAGEKPPNPPPARAPSVNPFAHGIAASGLVEAASRNIAVAAPEAGMVTAVLASVGDVVRQGQPLFQLDARAIDAELVRGEAAVRVAAARVRQVESMPRPEDLPPLRAMVEAARSRHEDARTLHARALEAQRAGGSNPSEVERAEFAARSAAGDLAEAEARLALTQAGAWGPEIDVARAVLAQAEADVASWKIRKDRLTVRSPINGVVLQREIEPGEYAMAASGAGVDPPMVVGDISTLHVRAQVNEEDAPQLRVGAKGVARVRGAYAVEVGLRMLRIEPLARPKKQLTGAASELVDTRVVEVVFEAVPDERMTSSGITLYPGQLVDVFIEATPPGQAGGVSPGFDGRSKGG